MKAIPKKGTPVLVLNSMVMFSMGEASVDGSIRCNIRKDLTGVSSYYINWQEVEIKPVVHVPEDMRLCAVWQTIDKPKFPCYRLSSGNLDIDGCLLCYMDDGVSSLGNNENTASWKHWEEV